MVARFFRKHFALGFLIFVAALFGCASRSYTKPRSEVIEDALERGVYLPSVDEERALFLEYEERQLKRILALIEKRTHQTISTAHYRLGAGDTLQLDVFDVPELNLSAKVRESGFLSLPLIGAVKAAGRTETELHYELYQRLSEYVRDPQLTVTISHFGSQKVAVMGAVRRPGMYSLKKSSNSLLELIGSAGGISKEAGNYITFIPSELSGLGARGRVEDRARLALASYDSGGMEDSSIEIYLDKILGTDGGIPLEIPVRGGDMIVIAGGSTVSVEGEVQKGGSYSLNRRMTLLGALASAGGITYGAKVDEVEVIRPLAGGSRLRYVVDLGLLGSGDEQDVRLRNGDIIRVPSDSGRRLGQDTFDGISRLINVGIGGAVPL